MELKQLCEKVLELFEINQISELGEKLLEAVLKHDISKFQTFSEIVKDLSVDWLQKIFQYYEADRNEKKQDYTPKSIAKLVSELTRTDGEIVYDICAGSGALTIQKWVQNPDKTFICEELDTKVIPFLLFNMVVRNMNGYVINRNVLTMETFKVYKVEKSDKFSTVSEIQGVPEIKADEIISNPPYNIKWTAPVPVFDNEIFCDKPVPPESNANYAFLFTAISRMNYDGKIAFVLPNGVTSFKPETDCRKYLIDNGLLESVIGLPDNMFECTSIGTCIYVISKGNKSVKMYDCRKEAVQETRDQRGQFGGNSHTNRVYHKTVNVLPDELIQELCGECKSVPDFSEVVPPEKIQENKYILAPNRYIQYDYSNQESEHRNLKDIVMNINYITQMQNSCKLVINETLAKKFGLDIELYKQSKQQSIDMHDTMKELLNLELETEDYIQFTKAKNELCFKCNSKEILSDIFIQFLSVWKNQIALLNTMQNQYLTELREAMLPDLMSGKLQLGSEQTEC